MSRRSHLAAAILPYLLLLKAHCFRVCTDVPKDSRQQQFARPVATSGTRGARSISPIRLPIYRFSLLRAPTTLFSFSYFITLFHCIRLALLPAEQLSRRCWFLEAAAFVLSTSRSCCFLSFCSFLQSHSWVIYSHLPLDPLTL